MSRGFAQKEDVSTTILQGVFDSVYPHERSSWLHKKSFGGVFIGFG
jgi:hypothetical protein